MLTHRKVLHMGNNLQCSVFSQGGIKAVIWTDVFQIVVMLFGFIAVYVQGTVLAGGPARVLEIAYNGSRINFNEYKQHQAFLKLSNELNKICWIIVKLWTSTSPSPPV